MTKVSSKITILAVIDVLPSFEEEVYKAATDIWVATRKEEGCEAFIFNTNKDTGLAIFFFEVFTSQEAFDIHREAPHTKYFLEFLKGKIAGDGPVLTFLNQITD